MPVNSNTVSPNFVATEHAFTKQLIHNKLEVQNSTFTIKKIKKKN